MPLVYDDLLGHHDKVQEAIGRLKAFEPAEGYFLAFSGGKDSQAVYHLAKLAGVKFDAHYSLTTVDPPPLVKFVKDFYPDVIIDKSYWRSDGKGHKVGDPITMWNLIVDRGMPPTRKARYCCAELKESKGKGRVTVTGVRWEESWNRRKTHGMVDVHGNVKKIQDIADEARAMVRNNGRGTIIMNSDNDASRKVVEQCFQKNKTVLNPIIDWTEEDVWEFLNDVAKVPHCELYDQGWKRLGCIGCPMSSVEERRKSFEAWPQYKLNYIRAFQRMIDARHAENGSALERERERETEGLPRNRAGAVQQMDELPVSVSQKSSQKSELTDTSNCGSTKNSSTKSKDCTEVTPANLCRGSNKRSTESRASETSGQRKAGSQEHRCSIGSTETKYDRDSFDGAYSSYKQYNDAEYIFKWWKGEYTRMVRKKKP